MAAVTIATVSAEFFFNQFVTVFYLSINLTNYEYDRIHILENHVSLACITLSISHLIPHTILCAYSYGQRNGFCA